jgi:hypothetical protein
MTTNTKEAEVLSLNDLALFKKKYSRALKSGAVSFEFKGDEILTDDAKYVIEFYSLKFVK